MTLPGSRVTLRRAVLGARPVIVSQLFIHPLKSAAALAVHRLDIEPRGPRDDRRWMLVDEAGRLLSGRELGALVTLRALPHRGGLQLQWGAETWAVATPGPQAERVEVEVWSDRIDAALADAGSQRWLSERLQRAVRLVYMDQRSVRWTDPDHTPAGSPVSFADGYPLLLLGEAALAELQGRVGEALPATRFRPNIVFSGGEPHAEDGWRRLRIGGVEFDLVKPCVRCVFTTVDPASGERDPRGEPLTSLKSYRRTPKGITFGMNLRPRGEGGIELGMAVEPLA